MAANYVRRERANQTLQPTVLVNELFLRLIDQSQPIAWQSRSHFFGIAARVMRRVLVDHSRSRYAWKRGGRAIDVSFEENLGLSTNKTPEIMEVDAALSRLAELDPRKAQLIELRYFGGLNLEEIVQVAGISLSTVRRDLRLGEAWLKLQLMGTG
jgi:RNA polymerase sigma factor (TIGR02999 family)